MKFGKRLLSEAERRWMAYYVDYKALKRAIQSDIERQDPTGKSFAETLQGELAKVAAFYSAQEQDLENGLNAVTSDGAHHTSIALLRSEVLDLRKFVVLNYIAVVKAVKKRNRHLRAACGALTPSLRAVDILAGQHFFTSLKLAALITRIEILSRECAPPGAPQGDSQDFACPICLSMLRSPVVLSCAHRFCWGCLMAHCTAVRSASQHGHSVTGAGKNADVAKPAVWVSDSSDDENASVATFACPCCRKDQLLDLERLQVDPHLEAFMQKLGTACSTYTEMEMDESDKQPAAMTSLMVRLEKAATATATQPIDIKSSSNARSMDIDTREDVSVSLENPGMLAAVEDNPPSAVVPLALPPGTAEIPAAVSAAAAAAPAPAVAGGVPLLPPQMPEHRGRLTVCLDLDGTLVTTFTPKRAPTLPATAVTYVVGRGGKLNPGGVFVVERPGLGDFLRHISTFSEVVLFTAGLEDYASPICDEIERRYGPFAHRLYRPATIHSDAYPCVKDLSRLGRDINQCILVDDTPLAFFHQPDCGIPVLQFRGDVDDRLLPEAVTPLLEELAAGGRDVRIPLAKRFNMSRWFAAQGLEVPKEAALPAGMPSKQAKLTALARTFSAPTFPQHAQQATSTTRASPFAMHNAPAGQLLNSCPASDVLLVCDFDKTLTDWDSGERLCDELAPELTSLLAQVESPANFVPTTNAVLAEMQRRGIFRDRIVSALRSMGSELPGSTLNLLQWAKRSDVDVRILSDCNSVFISHILSAAKVHDCVRKVVTNSAAFQRVPAATAEEEYGQSHHQDGTTSVHMTTGASASQPNWASRKPSATPQHRLVIEPRYDHKRHGSHGCPLCPANLCKGRELDEMRSGCPRRRTIYAGDGANDLCPALCLGPDDVVLARAGHPLERLLAGHAENGGALAARVMIWRDHNELALLVRQAVTA